MHSKRKGSGVAMYLALSSMLMTYYLPSPGLSIEDLKLKNILCLSSRSSQYREPVGDSQTVHFNVG